MQSDDSKEPDVVEYETFPLKKEAQAFIRKMIAKYGMQRHAGHIVNYMGRFELFTNY